MRLGSAMSPSGRMDVRVFGAATKGGRRTQLHRFVADVADQEVLVHRPKMPWTGVRFLRVEILGGPLWVAWREITVLDR